MKADPVFLVSYYSEHPGHWPHKWQLLMDLLTSREVAILDLRARGMSWRKIARSEEIRRSTNTRFESLGIGMERTRQVGMKAARRLRWWISYGHKRAERTAAGRLFCGAPR